MSIVMEDTVRLPKPEALSVDFDAIPEALKQRRQWVLWKYIWKAREKKWDKPPYQVNGKLARSTDTATWDTYENIWDAYQRDAWDGIGFVVGNDDDIVFLDLDGCRDPTTGRIEPWSSELRAKFVGSVPDPMEILATMQTYAEYSPSGAGFHLFCIGDVPKDGSKIGGKGSGCPDGLEIYKARRYATITGQRVPSAPPTVNTCSGKLDNLHVAVFGEQQKPAKHAETSSFRTDAPVVCDVPDELLFDAIFGSAQGAKFRTLHQDNASGYPSASEADSAYLWILAWWTRNAQQIERIARGSQRVRSKWDDKRGANTWLEDEIQKALDGVETWYDWRKNPAYQAVSRQNLPQIDASNEDLHTITEQAWDALEAGNSPERLFRFGAQLVRVEWDDANRLMLRDVTLDRMRFELTAAAFWFRRAKRKSEGEEPAEKRAAPSDKVVKNVLATPDPNLPRLTRIVAAPVFAPDGSMQTEPGYHPGGRTYYAPAPGLEIPAVPMDPTAGDMRLAHGWILTELLGDFPFLSDAERAHAVEVLLLPFARDLIDGPTPFHLIEKPSPGTGASLLMNMLALPATGSPAFVLTEGRDEDEWRKRVSTKRC